MKTIYKIIVKVADSKPIECLFDNQKMAERVVFMIKSILNEEGAKKVTFETEKVSVISSERDVLEAIDEAFK